MCEKGEWEGRGSIWYSRHLCHRYMSTMRFYFGLPQLHSDHCVCLACRRGGRERGREQKKRRRKKRQQNRVKNKCLRLWNWKGQGDSERWKPFRCCAADRVVCHWGFGQARVGSVMSGLSLRFRTGKSRLGHEWFVTEVSDRQESARSWVVCHWGFGQARVGSVMSGLSLRFRTGKSRLGHVAAFGVALYHVLLLHQRGGRIFFTRVDFLCWLLFRYPFHPRVTAVVRKRSRSFCQKWRWQVTAKHAYTLHMWLCMKWHGAWLGVHSTCAETAAVSCGTSHASAVSIPLQWI